MINIFIYFLIFFIGILFGNMFNMFGNVLSNKHNKNVDTESNTEKKMTAAEKKLALKAVKLNSLTFKIKPIK